MIKYYSVNLQENVQEMSGNRIVNISQNLVVIILMFQDSPCTELTSNERLSLFSGMTFNTAISIQESTVNRPKEHVKTASEELAEAGLDLIVKKTLYQSMFDSNTT